jgi:hypothetical protein
VRCWTTITIAGTDPSVFDITNYTTKETAVFNKEASVVFGVVPGTGFVDFGARQE